LHAGGAAKEVIQHKRERSSWYKRRQQVRSSMVKVQKWLCGPFLGMFDDMHADADDEREERQYAEDVCEEYKEAGRGHRYLDLPVGSLPDEKGYSRKIDNWQANNPEPKLINVHVGPDIFLNDMWEVILVNIESDGVTKKKKAGQLIIDQLSPYGPPGDINKMMRWPVPQDLDADEEAVRNYQKLMKALTDTKAPGRAGWTRRPRLHSLEIIGCRLLQVPPVLREVPTLRHLRLSHNEIKLLTEEWLWPEDDRPVFERQYVAKNDHLTGSEAEQVQESFSDGIPCYRCEVADVENNNYRIIEKLPDQQMRWWETKWGRREVPHDHVLKPEDTVWKKIRPQRPDEEEAITDWLLAWPQGDDGPILAYPMELAGLPVISRQELEVRRTGSVISGVEPNEIKGSRDLPALEHLFLDWNSIYSIEVQALSGGVVAKLQVLNLSHNQLNVLPSDFMEGARELRYLDLTGNEKIRTIPDTVMACSKLELLFLTHNAIERLPPIRKVDAFGRSCKRLKRLRKLFVAYNRLAELPEDIGECGKLEKIRLSHNCIREMPRSLLKLRCTLQEFAFVGNPLQQPLKDGASIETNMGFFEDYWRQRDAAEEPVALGGEDTFSLPAFGKGTDLSLTRDFQAAAAARDQEDEVDVIHRPSNIGRFEANPRGPSHRRE